MFIHYVPAVTGIEQFLDPSTIQLILYLLTAVLGWTALRNRGRLKRIENDSVVIRSQAEEKKSADDRQEQLLNLLKGLLEQGSRATDLTQKAFEESQTSGQRWQKTVDTQAEALGNIALMVKEFREYSATQHKETRELGASLHKATRELVETNTRTLESKVDAVRQELTTIRTDLTRRVDEFPALIDRKFQAIDRQLELMLVEIRKTQVMKAVTVE